jgi:peptide chain release factor 2
LSKCRCTFDVAALRERLAHYDALMAGDGFWNDVASATKINLDASAVRERLGLFTAVAEHLEDLQLHWSLLKDDPAEEGSAHYDDFERELQSMLTEIARLEVELLLDGEYDNQPADVTIHAGAGGTESCDWAEMLYRMYAMWAPIEGLKLEVTDQREGDVAGVQSITFRLTGRHAYGYMKGEAGVHRLVRISPFDAAKRRHTSFASVDIIPELPETAAFELNEDEVKMDVFRSSSAGGQHVNKTSSAVRLTHLPTGIIVSCQNERSQHQNRAVAIVQLKSRIAALLREQHKERIEDLRATHTDIAWGNQIRSYVLHPYQMVKDLRTGHETANAQRVLDGELTPFIWSQLRWMRQQRES